MSSEHKDGPWLVILELEGKYACRITEDWSEVEREQRSADEPTNNNATATVIPLRAALAAPEMIEELVLSKKLFRDVVNNGFAGDYLAEYLNTRATRINEVLMNALLKDENDVAAMVAEVPD